MEVLYFLKQRTAFILRFYEAAGAPFRETIRKIEAEEDPFAPPYSGDEGDGEPPFLSEWIEADTSLEVLGRTCLSMLSASLELYFKRWEAELGLSCRHDHKKLFKQSGFLRGYRACFGEAAGIIWDECPADFAILEQVTLARNRDQHPEHITRLGVSHSASDREKYPRPFFTDEVGKKLAEDPDVAGISWMSPRVRVSPDTLSEAVRQVELLAGWLEERLAVAKYPQRR